MPELPEVETIVRQLQKKVAGKRIKKAEAYDKIVDPRIKNFSSISITSVRRRAKYIIVELSNGQYLLTHLGMTGHFHFVDLDQKRAPNNHERFMVAKFQFSDGSFLTHNSIRKFGHMKLVTKKQLEALSAKHGPEPLEKSFTLQIFQETLAKKSKANIKTTLMNQSIIAGIGNIYAQEALYFAGISPFRQAGSLSEKEAKALYTEIRRILQQAIKHHGSTVDNYSNLEGSGGFQNYLAVYQKEKCEKGHSLQKKTIGGRGTSYCSTCQQ
ncbi:MAG TPA: bifunctional DNA-formamidopyrimidine glycosylase/DNA-(apurinic or apyrimidinic site) lyase [Candidatus Nanoarchaeia archaeon]|nr:bifunctional DNA-formamidopyrimidine glycosylase/DNA-(apurinic or apyrimidinic site) lyase [Candidatus Nanoarchaeia archaeon]